MHETAWPQPHRFIQKYNLIFSSPCLTAEGFCAQYRKLFLYFFGFPFREDDFVDKEEDQHQNVTVEHRGSDVIDKVRHQQARNRRSHAVDEVNEAGDQTEWPAFQLHEKRALLLFIDLCAGIDFSSDDIYPHFLFAFRAIHRETKRQCILINLCFRLIVANRAINPYRFCGTIICQTVCSFFGCYLLLQTSTVLPSPNAMHTHFDICFHRKPHYPPQCSVPRPHRRRAGYRG